MKFRVAYILRSMKTQNAIKFFGGKPQLAKALGVQLSSLYDWKDVVPFARQQQIEEITGGKLKAMTWAEFLASKKVAA